MLRFRLFALLACILAPLTLTAQLRDMHIGRLILDDDGNDGGFHRLIISTGSLPFDSYLRIPAPLDSNAGYFLISNPSTVGGQQMSGPFSLDELRLNSSGTSFYNSFMSPAGMANNVLYTLPSNGPTQSGATLTSTTGGLLSWSLPGSTNWLLGGNIGTIPGTHYLGTGDSTAMQIQVRDTTGLILNSFILNEDSSLQRDSGGDGRGAYAVDLQMDRFASDRVASGSHSVIGGGGSNKASGLYATVGGGEGNQATAQSTTVGGGAQNAATGLHATVGGGFINAAIGESATVSGGVYNAVVGVSSTIGGGEDNVVLGGYSAIPGGFGLRLDASAVGSFGFLGYVGSATVTMGISAPQVAVFGNTDLWLANNDNAASQIRFYESYNASVTDVFPNGTNYTSFEAGAQTADINYTLPTATPSAATSGTDLGSGYMESDDAGTMSWRQSVVVTATNLNFGTVAAQSSGDVTVTVTGAAVGDIVNLGVDNAAVLANSSYTAWVSAVNTVTVRFNNYSVGAQTPGTTNTFKVQVTK